MPIQKWQKFSIYVTPKGLKYIIHMVPTQNQQNYALNKHCLRQEDFDTMIYTEATKKFQTFQFI